MTEAELIAGIKTGSRGALEQLIRRYQRLVGAIVFRILPDVRDREEVCQDVFLKVYESLPGWRGESALSTWIGRIAWNQALTYLKRHKRHRREMSLEFFSSEEEEGPRFHDPADADPDPFIQLSGVERHALMERAISQLPLQYATALTLFHMQQLEISEIAQIMDAPEGTVKSAIFRARKLLKISLEKQIPQEELWN